MKNEITDTKAQKTNILYILRLSLELSDEYFNIVLSLNYYSREYYSMEINNILQNNSIIRKINYLQISSAYLYKRTFSHSNNSC